MNNMHAPTTSGAAAQELLRVLKLRKDLNARGNVTLGDIVDLGLANWAGNLSNPQGYWDCPWCWMDYERPAYRSLNT